MEGRLNISQVAALYQISARTLRYYEEAGLLSSHRKEGSKYREYDREQLGRLEVILLLRRLSFSVKLIEELLRGDGAHFGAALHERVTQSGRQVAEARETDRLLRGLASRLALKPPSALNAAEMLGDYVYLTKRTERMLKMSLPPEKEKYRVALGYALALDVCNENAGDLLNKIKALRAELEKEAVTFPMLRVYDSDDLAQNQALLVWAGKEIWRKDFQLNDATACADEIIARIKGVLTTG